MGRIIGIDYGRKRTGIAVTDPMKIIASRLDTLSSVTVILFLKDYIAKNDVECIVVGYPKQLNNQGSESLKYINPFLQKLVKEFPDIKIEQMDERFTSKIAFQTMIDAGVKKKDRQDKGLVDGVSATIILQSYLDKISHF